MSDFNDLLPEERNEQNQHLLASLRRSYDTHEEDQQSLTRIRRRFLQVSAGPLPYKDLQRPIEPRPTQSRQKGKADMQFIHNPFAEGKTWQQRLGTIAAAILVLALVGSMATLFYVRSHSSELGSPKQGSGWKQVASFTGTGSKTLTHLNIHLTQLWGYSAGCTGNANFNLELVEIENIIGSSCTTKAFVSPRVEPQSFQLGDSSRLIVDTIKITAPSNLTWYLRIANSDASAMPFLNTLTASKYEWTVHSGMGGSGEGEFTNSSLGSVKTLGLLVLCDEKETLQINFKDSKLGTKTFACNTNTNFYIVHFEQSVQLQTIHVRGPNIGYWFLTTVLCTNEKACSSLK